MQPITRDALSRDSNAILRINRDSLSGVSVLNREYFVQLLTECTLFRVIEVDEEVAGYVCILDQDANYDGEEFQWFRKHLGEGFLYIDQVAISQDYRGRGLGRTLYDSLELYASQNRINTLACEVNYEPLNIESQEFHRRCGFDKVGRMKTRGLVVSLLVKDLVTKSNNQRG
jgi:predicted GNAT superfamily acetyltransferase